MDPIIQVLPSDAIYLQLGRFAVVLILGLVITQLVLVPLITRITDRRHSSKKARHQLKNVTVVIGTFISFTAALQAGQFGGLVTIIGAVAAALTVAIGFGMREEVGNLVAGLFIHLDNPFVKGDYIEINDEEGEVSEISLRATYLNGHASEQIMVPNAKISSGNLKNYTRGIKTKSAIPFKLPPTKVEQVAEMVKRIAEEDDEILESPSPSILYRKYEDEKMVFELRYWVRDSDDSKRIRSRILDKLNNEAVGKGIFEESEDEEDK